MFSFFSICFLSSVLGLAIVSWSGRLGLGARDARYEGQDLSVARFFYKNISCPPSAQRIMNRQ